MRLIYGEYEQNISYCRKRIIEDFFEFDFPFVPISEKFREIDRFLWESRHQCTRFQNRYEGRAVIDITDWNRHYPNDYFDAFMYFLKGSEAFVSCTLISSEPYTQAVLDKLNRLFDTKKIVLEPDGGFGTKERRIGFCASMGEEEQENV